jgi:hypothetical protein
MKRKILFALGLPVFAVLFVLICGALLLGMAFSKDIREKWADEFL